jgi:hypothetical protein
MNNENTFFNDKSTSGGKTTNLPPVERSQIYLWWKDHKSTSGVKTTNQLAFQVPDHITLKQLPAPSAFQITSEK